MGLLKEEKVTALYDMGFELLCEYDDMVKFIHSECGFIICLYHSEKRDSWQGVYMDICDLDGIAIKELKGKNVISNAKRYIDRCKQKGSR